MRNNKKEQSAEINMWEWQTLKLSKYVNVNND